DVSYTKSEYDEATGIKTVYLGSDALNNGGLFGLNAVFAHEAYRDGVDSGEGQKAELEAAVTGHINAVLALSKTYGIGAVNDTMTIEALVYNYAMSNDDRALIESILNGYDNSADYWKLVKKDTNTWGWIDDKSADFDISDLLNDSNFKKQMGLEKGTLLESMISSGTQDGKGFGIISAGRMTSDLAAILGYVVSPSNDPGVLYFSSPQTTTTGLIMYSTGLNPLVTDTLEKIAYNAVHTTTVFDNRNRPVTLFNIEEGNSTAKELLKQYSPSLSGVENMAKSGCNFMDIISVPQLLMRQTLDAQQVTEIWNMAIAKNILQADGYVLDRNAIANLALQKLDISNIGINLTKTQTKNSSLVGYRVEVPYGDGGHFVLTGIDKSLVYNPGRTPIGEQNKWKSILEVAVYAR
ncbi:MAG: hypothetical protein FWD78_17880, partial [Treponema sp.]|nr:hypothetical protein [Treponema sp.]